jgi:hypothetical protein
VGDVLAVRENGSTKKESDGAMGAVFEAQAGCWYPGNANLFRTKWQMITGAKERNQVVSTIRGDEDD